MRVLVTGASGFVGKPLVDALVREGHCVRAAVRDLASAPDAASETVLLPDLSKPFVAHPLLADCDAVVHVAGLAHSGAPIPAATYFAVNRDATEALANASRAAGVKLFVYVSSVRAQIGPNAIGALTERNEPTPCDVYGHSKLAGEQGVVQALSGSATAYIILRPVLMYGPGAKGNMATLMKLARTNLALPVGKITARRSILGIDNFCSAVAHVLRQPLCRNQTYLVADGAPVTVGEILTAFRLALKKSPRIVNMPVRGAGRVLTLLGKRNVALRLLNDLVVSTDTLQATGWKPPLPTGTGLANAING